MPDPRRCTRVETGSLDSGKGESDDTAIDALSRQHQVG